MVDRDVVRIDPWLDACRAGVVLATGFGALTGAVLGSEVAEHWYQLYKMDKQGANLRFIYWWEDKVSGVLLPSGFISSHLFPKGNTCYVLMLLCRRHYDSNSSSSCVKFVPGLFFTVMPMWFDMCRLSELGF